MSIMQGKCTLCGKPCGNLIKGTKCPECVTKYGLEGHPGPIMDRAEDNFTSKKGPDRNREIKQMKHLKALGVQGINITIEDLKKATQEVESVAEKPKKVKKDVVEG